MIGRTLANYQIIEEIGRGGMAIVYRAFQPSLNRYVAMKVLPPQLSFDQQFVERFQREARSAARLRHPNIVVIHDVGQQEGTYYIVMEYLEGGTLKQLIEEEGSLPPERVARIVDQVAAALDYAHQQGFVHRDIKPSNIFVGKGDHVTLTDFGIAKAAAEAEQLTRTGTLMGTPEYMSPEQAEGGTVDHRTDVYALGVVIYQMLTGRVPFRGTTPHATLHAVIYEPSPPPRQINPNIPPAIESVILRAIAKRPEQRFQSTPELSSALSAAVARRPAPDIMPPPPPGLDSRAPSRPAPRRSPVVWIVAAMAAILIVMLVVLVLLFSGGGSQDGTPLPATTQAVALTTPTLAITEGAPADTPTPTLEPTATATPSPTDTAEAPTDTPTPTATPEPPTDTPTPTPTPSPPPTTPSPPPCAFPAQGLFASLWQTYRAQLGCPLYQNPRPIQDAEQAFDNGHMFWRQDNDYAYVVYEKGGLMGNYQAFVDMWSEGDPDYSCAATPPGDRVQPKRGFGAVWCTLGGASAAIGWGLEEEVGFGPGYGDPIVQDFEQGFILRDSDGKNSGQAYLFFTDGMKFVRDLY